MSIQELSPTEFKVYEAILKASEKYQPASIEDIYAAIGGNVENHEEAMNYVQTILVRVRKKLTNDKIITRNGIGYVSDAATR